MPTIFVKPIEITIEMKSGETLYKSLERAGVQIETPCGGNGICGRCRIWAEEPDKIPLTPNENIFPDEESQGLRLACVAIPKASTVIRLEDNYLYDKKEQIGEKEQQNHSYLRILSSDITRNRGGISSVVTDIEDRISSPKGLAIDIGTTTLVISLVSLTTGKIVASGSSLNPQVVHGHDVLSRIQYASTSNGLSEMAALIRNKLNELVEKACSESDSQTDEIVDVAIGANTTMLQIAAAIDPTPLGHLPFKVDISGATTFPATQFGLHVSSRARVYIPPVMHAFVGSDISAGLLCCPDFFENNRSVLYLDMGTNGEICLNVRGQRFTTSTAAGPAFEGMGISSGMRATEGAVERVDVRDGKLIFHLIGDPSPESVLTENNLTESHFKRQREIRGVCGSGIVDLIAALLTTDLLDRSGKLRVIEDEQSQMVGSEQLKVVKINSQPAFCYGENLYLTQKDIRQIQLAKGAVRTGIDLILQRGGISCEELDKIYIAGGFGNFLNPASMERIGLLPEHSSEKVIFCGNASIDGSIMLLTNTNGRTFLKGALHKMEHLQLADLPEFMNCFVKNLNFG